MDLDAFDRKLLDLIQEDAGRTAEQLAESIDLSASAIQRRLKRLREVGVISRDIAVLAPEKVGRPTFFITSLEVERERPELAHQLRGWLARERRIQQVYYVTGEADYVLVVTAASAEAYDALMTRLVNENPNVKRFRTNVALGVIKRGLTIPCASD